MEITSAVQFQDTLRCCADLFYSLPDQFRVEIIFVICVRRGNEVGCAVFGGHADHRDGYLKSRGTVVESVQNVAMDVYQFQFYSGIECRAAGGPNRAGSPYPAVC